MDIDLKIMKILKIFINFIFRLCSKCFCLILGLLLLVKGNKEQMIYIVDYYFKLSDISFVK